MDDQSTALETVLEFSAAMNNWESKMRTFSRFEDGKHVSEAARQTIVGETRESLDQYFFRNLERYCTSANVADGGKPTSWGEPTKYSGVDERSIIEVVVTPENSIEVTATSDYFIETVYKFILVKTGSEWKIAKLQTKDGEEWEDDFLC